MLLGCQSADLPARAERSPASAHPSAHFTPAAEAQFVHAGQQRVHVLLARRVELPFEVESQRVQLGAGDALGEQMFERYASFVRSQQRHDDREFVHRSGSGREPARSANDAAASTPSPESDDWVDSIARVVAPRF